MVNKNEIHEVSLQTKNIIETIKEINTQIGKFNITIENIDKTLKNTIEKMSTPIVPFVAPKPISTTPASTQINPIVNKFCENLIETLEDTQVWTIVIAIGILLIIIIKGLSMCKKVYKIHNEKIIMKARTSPQL